VGREKRTMMIQPRKDVWTEQKPNKQKRETAQRTQQTAANQRTNQARKITGEND
jgi:hypothetical protein